MNYRRLGKSNLKLSEIGFGCWGFADNKGIGYGKINLSEAKKSIKLAIEKGINFFDTANTYGNGNSEKFLGQNIKKDRNKIIIASKGGCEPHEGQYMPQDFSSKYLEKSLNGSLKRLKTDYIDLYQLHSPRKNDVSDETIDFLNRQKKKGKIRYFGISARSPQDAEYFIKKFKIDTIQINFNLIDQRILNTKIFSIVKRKKIGIISRTPLVFGFLTGKLKSKFLRDKKDHRLLFPIQQRDLWENSINLFKNLKKKNTASQFALRYCLDFKEITSVIPGMIKRSEVSENIKASNLKKLTNLVHLKIKKLYSNNNFYFDYLRSLKDLKPK